MADRTEALAARNLTTLPRSTRNWRGQRRAAETRPVEIPISWHWSATNCAPLTTLNGALEMTPRSECELPPCSALSR